MATPSIIWTRAALSASRAGADSIDVAEHLQAQTPHLTRQLTLLHLAIYNAWAVFDPLAATTLAGLERVDPGTPSVQVDTMHGAAWALLDSLYPHQASALKTTLAEALGRRFDDRDPSACLGQRIARDLLERARDDEQVLGTDPDSHDPVNPPLDLRSRPVGSTARPDACLQPGRWRPLWHLDARGRPCLQAFRTVHWHRLRPLALRRSDQLRPPAPPRPRSQAFVDQARYLVELQSHLDPDQRRATAWWTHDPLTSDPTRRWHALAAQVSERRRHQAADDARLFLALGLALHDAALGAWNAKQYHDYCRPISAIRHLFADRHLTGWDGHGFSRVRGDQWLPYQPLHVPSPPSPEYASEVSALAWAAAEVLRRFTHSDVADIQVSPAPGDLQETEATGPVGTLHWTTYSAAARQAGLATLYGGIQFYEGQEAGAHLGQQVGQLAFDKAQAYWLGAAPPGAA